MINPEQFWRLRFDAHDTPSCARWRNGVVVRLTAQQRVVLGARDIELNSRGFVQAPQLNLEAKLLRLG